MYLGFRVELDALRGALRWLHAGRVQAVLVRTQKRPPVETRRKGGEEANRKAKHSPQRRASTHHPFANTTLTSYDTDFEEALSPLPVNSPGTSSQEKMPCCAVLLMTEPCGARLSMIKNKTGLKTELFVTSCNFMFSELWNTGVPAPKRSPSGTLSRRPRCPIGLSPFAWTMISFS